MQPHLKNPLASQGRERTRWAVIRRWGVESIFLAVVLVALWVYFAPNRAEFAKAKRRESEKAVSSTTLQREQRAAILALAKRYDAITGWRSRLGGRTAFDSIYSAEFASVILTSDRRPVLFIASLQDVGQADGRYVLLLDGLINFHTHFRLHLSCSDLQANSILGKPRDEDGRFAVIAEITSVDSEAERLSSDEGGSSSGHPALGIRGNLVAFQFLGPYSDDLQEILATFRNVQ